MALKLLYPPVLLLVILNAIAIVPLAFAPDLGLPDPGGIGPGGAHPTKEELSHLPLLAITQELLAAAVCVFCFLAADAVRQVRWGWLLLAVTFLLLVGTEAIGVYVSRGHALPISRAALRASLYAVGGTAYLGLLYGAVAVLPRYGRVQILWLIGLVFAILEAGGALLGNPETPSLLLEESCEVVSSMFLLIAATLALVRHVKEGEAE